MEVRAYRPDVVAKEAIRVAELAVLRWLVERVGEDGTPDPCLPELPAKIRPAITWPAGHYARLREEAVKAIAFREGDAERDQPRACAGGLLADIEAIQGRVCKPDQAPM